jgi:hypothetical protein
VFSTTRSAPARYSRRLGSHPRLDLVVGQTAPREASSTHGGRSVNHPHVDRTPVWCGHPARKGHLVHDHGVSGNLADQLSYPALDRGMNELFEAFERPGLTWCGPEDQLGKGGPVE